MKKLYVVSVQCTLQSLENRVSILEDESVAKPSGPEPILTCVQCFAEYKESENARTYVWYRWCIVDTGVWCMVMYWSVVTERTNCMYNQNRLYLENYASIIEAGLYC